jgi:hypothetical protein
LLTWMIYVSLMKIPIHPKVSVFVHDCAKWICIALLMR